jgi:hypothetical protein
MPIQRRIKRDYRRLTPAKFLSYCHKVKHGLTDNSYFTDEVWGHNLVIRQRFFEKVDAVEFSYHAASNGDRVLIRERDKVMEETVVLLDEVASLLEAAAVRNPDALFTTGFSVTQERRATQRVRLPMIAPSDFVVVNTGETRKAIGSASSIPGAYNHEIHVNLKDPSVEEEWFHKAMYPDSASMVIDNVNPGNAFFRMRHHGPEGPGPWSAVVTTTIT